jgi:hypothetical protein
MSVDSAEVINQFIEKKNADERKISLLINDIMDYAKGGEYIDLANRGDQFSNGLKATFRSFVAWAKAVRRDFYEQQAAIKDSVESCDLD